MPTQGRYNFCIEYIKDEIFVIGGREYGNDEIAIIDNCLKFNLISNKWSQIADLNVARC